MAKNGPPEGSANSESTKQILDVEVLEIQELEFSEFEKAENPTGKIKQFLVASCTTCTCTCSCCTSI